MEITTTFSVWFILMTLLGISINGGLSQGQQHLMKKTRSVAVVVGTVYCDTCFNSAFSKSPNHLISDLYTGAVVAVECIDENSNPSFRQEVKTDEHGEFKANLPFSVSKHVKKIKRCSVKLLSSSQPYCSIAASATSSSLKRLRSSKHGENTRVFSAGFFTFKPENQPEICSQKPINLRGSKPLFPDPTFPPPIQDPVPDNPLPILPILPPLPDLLPTLPPLLPGPSQKSASLHHKKDSYLEDKKTKVLKPDSVLPPNPVKALLPPNPLNPPSIIPPNPVTPLLPPIPLVSSPPSLPPLKSLPPVPVITPPSQPSPSFSVSLPPIFIGIPPASSSFSSHPQP
ncbi:proline-rich extensin-like protein EPR1 isoform X1 [Brassica rapa]|uniref:proline-rich extensin-like protein EPR1 isoform X1 n=1 Tax=Brassica campestris TaxID=3711 RepID=UPI00142E7BE1|nr:proline-rich extensin-like protein EPR1 isoform X1 [Brassica rapa]